MPDDDDDKSKSSLGKITVDSFPPSDPYQKEKLPQGPQLPLLREWPPPPPLEQPQRSIGCPTLITLYKPLPEPSSSSRPLTPIEDTLVPFADYDSMSIYSLPEIAEEDSVETVVITHIASPRADQDSAGRSSLQTGNGSTTASNGNNGVPKKVDFHPPPSGLTADRPLQDASTSNNSTVVRSQPSRPKDPRGSMSTAASGSRPDVVLSQNSSQTVEATSTSSVMSYSAKSAYEDGALIHQSLRSATPFSQKASRGTLFAASWSDVVEADLLTHLEPREQTRQEVLWEIAASEERYGFYPCLLNKFDNFPADMSLSCSR